MSVKRRRRDDGRAVLCIGVSRPRMLANAQGLAAEVAEAHKSLVRTALDHRHLFGGERPWPLLVSILDPWQPREILSAHLEASPAPDTLCDPRQLLLQFFVADLEELCAVACTLDGGVQHTVVPHVRQLLQQRPLELLAPSARTDVSAKGTCAPHAA